MRKRLVAFRPHVFAHVEQVLQDVSGLGPVEQLAVEEALMEFKYARDLYDGKAMAVSMVTSGYWELEENDVGENWT